MREFGVLKKLNIQMNQVQKRLRLQSDLALRPYAHYGWISFTSVRRLRLEASVASNKLHMALGVLCP